MSTYDHYATPVEPGTWDVPAAGTTKFSWEYDDGRSRLLDLYQRGKDKQWDAAKRIDWDLPVDPTNVMETPDDFCPIFGSRQWDVLNDAERKEHMRQTRVRLSLLPPDRFPRTIESAEALTACDDPDFHYQLGIEMFIAGVQAMAATVRQ